MKNMNTKETNTGCVIKYTLTATHQCAKQVYRCATKLSPRNQSAVEMRINRPFIAAYLQSNNNTQNSYPFATVVYLGYGSHGSCHGRRLDRGAKKAKSFNRKMFQ